MKRNVLVQVNDISFFAKGTEVWYCCHVFCDDWAEGLVPHREIGGWDDAERSAVMDTLPERGGIDGDCKDHFGVRFHFLASFVRAASGSSVATKVQTSWGPSGPQSPKEIDLTSFCLAASRS